VRARTAAFILGAVLVIYLGMCLWKGALAIYDGFHQGGAAAGLLGAALLIFGFLGSWFLVREIQFGFATERLAHQLDDEGALGQEELDALPRSPGGRVDRAAADRLFERRKSETEAAPEDWRTCQGQLPRAGRHAPCDPPPRGTRHGCRRRCEHGHERSHSRSRSREHNRERPRHGCRR
jgi:hypothetical protein